VGARRPRKGPQNKEERERGSLVSLSWGTPD
jgi:hypothetical protein